MSPETFATAKNLFLIFPGGCGGNHLANLLSLTPEFQPRFEDDCYVDTMLEKYEDKFKDNSPVLLKGNLGGTVAHFSYLENLQESILNNYRDWLTNNQKINILCSHLYEYVSSEGYGILEGLDHRIFCVFSFPSKDSIAYKRATLGPWVHGELLSHPHSESQYNKKTLDKGFIYNNKHIVIPSDRTFEINTELFMSERGFDYIKEVCYNEMGVTIPEIGKNLHLMWLRNIKEAMD